MQKNTGESDKGCLNYKRLNSGGGGLEKRAVEGARNSSKNCAGAFSTDQWSMEEARCAVKWKHFSGTGYTPSKKTINECKFNIM